MATYQIEALELEEETSPVDFNNIPPGTLWVMVSDDKGNKKILKLDMKNIKPSQTILRNTTAGLCYKLFNGVWQWMPC